MISIIKKSERQDLNLRPLPPQGSTLPSCATSRFLNYSIIIAQLGALFRSLHMLRDGTAVNNFNCLLWKHLHNGSCHVPINFFKTWHCLVATLPPLTKQYLIVLFGRVPRPDYCYKKYRDDRI